MKYVEPQPILPSDVEFGMESPCGSPGIDIDMPVIPQASFHTAGVHIWSKENASGGTLPHRIQARYLIWLLTILLLLGTSSWQVNDYDPDPNFEYRENFLYTKAVGVKTEMFITNVNGTITVIGVDTLSEARISGTKIVKDQSEDAAMQHMADITIDV